MSHTEPIVAEPRSEASRGKNESRRVRRAGRIPAVLYGARKSSVAVTVSPREITHILHSESGHNTIFDLQVGDERTKAMIVDWQYEPVRGVLLHVDLMRIAMDQRLRVKVPILLKGEAEGVKQQGGILEQLLREVEVECLPGDIPGHIDVDVSHLVFGVVLRVANLPHSEKLKFVSDASYPVAHIVAVKEEVAPAPEAALEAAAAVPAEPEVIKKGKQETEEEAAAAAAEASKPEKKEKEKK